MDVKISKIQLSRLLITGYVHENTPLCVLIEIADAHGIKYDPKHLDNPLFSHHLLSTINKTPISCIGHIKGIDEWGYIARFVNKEIGWTTGKLTPAYNFLLTFMNTETALHKLPESFVIGSQTGTTPFSINACILYKICVQQMLTINARTTINQMAYAVRMLSEPTESILRRTKSLLSTNLTRTDLINVLLLSPHQIQDPEPCIMEEEINYKAIPNVHISYDYLTRVHIELHDIKSLRNRIDPNTNDGAVALAALNYSIDISKAINPMREYKILKINTKNEYVPVDKWLHYWYSLNPILFDLSISFNPIFPISYYDTRTIDNMIHNAGYTSAEIADSEPYELLQLEYLSETFYLGEIPNMKTEETPILLDNIKDVEYGQLLCFGQLDFPMSPISIIELTQLFSNNKNFSNIFRRDSIFTKTAISKLKLLMQSNIGPNPRIPLSAETIGVRANLLNRINGVEILLQSNDLPSRDLSSIYNDSLPDTKKSIYSALLNILHLGMYMRGWIGDGNYPIIYAPAPPENEPDISQKITTSMLSFASICRSLGPIGYRILHLPLILYKDGEYQPAIDIAEGLTIVDRIDIVKDGNNTNNVNSCIRLSSNWFCSSAHKYIMCIGFPAPFDIYNLRHIS